MPTISPQFGGPARPAPSFSPANLKVTQPPSQATSGDQVRFGNDDKKADKTNKTDKSSQTDNPPPRQKPSIGTAAKNAFFAAVSPWGLVGDVGIGALLAIATVLIPPHAHALAMIPFSLFIGSSIRAFSAVRQTYWPSDSNR